MYLQHNADFKTWFNILVERTQVHCELHKKDNAIYFLA